MASSLLTPTTILKQYSQEENENRKEELLQNIIEARNVFSSQNIMETENNDTTDDDDGNNSNNENNNNKTPSIIFGGDDDDDGSSSENFQEEQEPEQYDDDNENDDDDDDDEDEYRPLSSSNNPIIAIGKQQYDSDKRQIGGLLFVLALCATFQPLDNVCTLLGAINIESDIDIGGGGSGSGSGSGGGSSSTLTAIEKSSIAAGIIQIGFGLFGMIVGYLSIIHDYSNNNVSAALIVVIQLGWMPYLVELTSIGMDASSPYIESTFRQIDINGQYLIVGQYIDNPWIPPVYLPSVKDVRFFGAMGIVGVMSYGFAFLGSFAFMAFSLYAFDINKPTQRDARYYRSRLLFYTSVVTLAGVSQLLLGSYIIFEFGSGPIIPAMGIAMYIVHYPEISVAVGLLQMFVGYFGMARYIGWAPIKPNDHQFQILILVQSVAMLVLQYIVQIGYNNNNNNYASPTSLALLSVGLNIMPAFLDYKMRTTPEYLTGEYYGILSSSTKDKYSSHQVAIGSSNNNLQQQQPLPREIPLGGVRESIDSTHNALLAASTPNRGNSNNPEASKNTTSTSTGMEDMESFNNHSALTGDNDIEQSTEFGLLGGRPNNSQPQQQQRGVEPPSPQPTGAERAARRSTEESDGLRKSVQWSNTGDSYYSDPTADHDQDYQDDDDDDERHREPSARLGSRRIDRNALTNELYEQLNQSQMTRRKSNRSVDKNSWDTGELDEYDNDDDTGTYDSPNTSQQEPSARLNSRKIDPNEIINQMYDEAAGTAAAAYTSEPLNDTVASRSLRSSPNDDDDDDYTGVASQPSAHSDARSGSNDIDAYSQPSAYSGYSQPSASGHGVYSEYDEDATSRDGYSAYSEGMSQPSATIHTVDSDEYSSDDPSSSRRHHHRRPATKRDDPPERIPSLSDDDLVREMFGNSMLHHDDPEDDEQGITIYKSYEEPNSNDLSDDSSQSTAALEGKLEEIENEIFTDAMQSVHDSLVNIL